MDILGNKVQRNDQVVLERDGQRVTVEYQMELLALGLDGASEAIGLSDQYNTNWITAPTYLGAWTVVGHIQAEHNKPLELPTREGYYVATYDKYNEANPGYVDPRVIYRDGVGQYLDLAGDALMDEAELRAAGTLIPLYGPDEHYTAISRNKDRIYNIVRMNPGQDDEHLACECKGYKFRQSCYHVTDLNRAIATSQLRVQNEGVE